VFLCLHIAGSAAFENVAKLKSFGTVVTNQKLLHKEIRADSIWKMLVAVNCRIFISCRLSNDVDTTVYRNTNVI
jgi:hypothetical protein